MLQIRAKLHKARAILMAQRQRLYEEQPDDPVDNPIAEAAQFVDNAQEMVTLALELLE